MEEFSERLNSLLLEKGVSKEELSDIFGEGCLELLFNSSTAALTVKALVSLSEFFDVSIDYITGKTEIVNERPKYNLYDNLNELYGYLSLTLHRLEKILDIESNEGKNTKKLK